MDINNNLFNLIKSQKWNDFLELLNKNSDVNVNIRDTSNNYLIQYAILFNNIESVKLILKRQCKLDILDIDGRTLLHNPIKYGYNSILETLLANEKDTVGISLLDHFDNKGLFPIHYAIIFKNINALKIILKFTNNIDVSDQDGNTALHYAIKIKDLDMYKLIIDMSPDINFQTNQGESPLHIACNFSQSEMAKMLVNLPEIDVNIQDYENQITPLMYSIILEDPNLFNLLIEKSNIEIQDINGNNPLHYAINENNEFIINKLIEKYESLYVTNLLGKTPIHLLLDNIKFNNLDVNKINFSLFLDKSNLNIQDYDGNSPFIMIAKLKLWKKYFDILKKKKINAYIKNNLNKNAFSYINEEENNLFLDLLSESYINILRTDNNAKWKNEIDTICKSNLSYKNFLSLKEKIDLEIDDSKLVKSSSDICPVIIKENIIKNKISFPLKIKNYCIDLETEKINMFVTYTGITLDIIFGMIYILKNYNNIATTSLTLNFKNNEKLSKYYMNNEEREVSDDEFLNIEIIWNNQNMLFPDILDEIVQKFKIDKEKRFLLIPVGIELSKDSHANIIFYDKESNEMERFEPNGSTFPFKFNYNPQLLDKLLKEKFSDYFPNLKYFSPDDYLPKIGFQLLEAYDFYKTKKIGDPGGFCAAWCTWYVFMRIKYSNIDRKKLCIKLISKIKEENLSFKNLIRNFASKIVSIRDNTLIEANLDINDWLNSNYEKHKLEKLILLIQQLIKELII